MVIGLCTAIGVVAFWGFPKWQLRQAIHAIDGWRFAAAEQWLDGYPWWAMEGARAQFLSARVARSEDGFARAQQHLQNARAGGFDPRIIDREQRLLYISNSLMPPNLSRQYDELLAESPHDRITVFEAFAVGNIGIGRYDEGFRYLDQWILEHPDDGRPLYWKGVVYEAKGEPDNARLMYVDATRRSPKLKDAYLALAKIGIDQGRVDRALDAYFLASQGDPTDPEPLLGQAEMLWRMRRRDEAFAILQPLVQKYPTLYPARLMIAQACSEKGMPAEVVNNIAPIMDQFPDSLQLNYLLATAYNELGDTKAAREAMYRFFIADQGLGELQYQAHAAEGSRQLNEILQVAAAYRRWDRGHELKWLQIALEIDPKSSRLHLLLARNYEESGASAKARRERNIAETLRSLTRS